MAKAKEEYRKSFGPRYMPEKVTEFNTGIPVEEPVQVDRVGNLMTSAGAVGGLQVSGGVEFEFDPANPLGDEHLDVVEEMEMGDEPWSPHEERAREKPVMPDVGPGSDVPYTPPTSRKPKELEEDDSGAAVEVGRRGPLKKQKDAFEKVKPGSKRKLEPAPDEEEENQ